MTSFPTTVDRPRYETLSEALARVDQRQRKEIRAAVRAGRLDLDAIRARVRRECIGSSIMFTQPDSAAERVSMYDCPDAWEQETASQVAEIDTATDVWQLYAVVPTIVYWTVKRHCRKGRRVAESAA